jgi:hypothetical protein
LLTPLHIAASVPVLEVASSNQEVVENREARGQEKGIGAGERKAIHLMD